uniref:hypothetical protein n=1 Tax=Ningiella ruwaisensis TaxID=2364274 RepID=UPI00109F8C1A|nr:hypothetical protein [Ningiella ruwaisensis]
MKIFNELRRRNVFKVASVYLVTAWLIIQIISVISEPLHLPNVFATIVTVLLSIGFPIALIFAWAFELTPEGMKLTTDADSAEQQLNQGGSKLNILLASLLIVAVAFIGYQQFWQTEPASVADKSVSIAVLPFDDMSPDKSQEYFGDGMAEELLNALARLKQLVVISRTSSFAFKGERIDIRDIGNILNVAYVLEGSVRKDADNVRITAQLIDVSSGAHIWSETYDRKMTSIFELQDELTLSITEALKLNLLPEDISQQVGMTNNPNAYELFIKARELQYKRSADALIEAEALLLEALALDRNFHQARSQLYVGYQLSTYYGGFTREESAKKMERTFWELQDSPNFPLKLAAVALQSTYDAPDDLSYDLSLSLYRQAHEAAPSEPFIAHNYAILLSIFGKVLEAMELREEVLKIDPKSLSNYGSLASIYLHLGKIDELYELKDKVKKVAPGSWMALFVETAITYPLEQNVAKIARLYEQYDGEQHQNYLEPYLSFVVLNGEFDKAISLIDEQLSLPNPNIGAFVNAYSLLYGLKEQQKLSSQQKERFNALPVSPFIKQTTESVWALLNGDASPYMNQFGWADLPLNELVEASGLYPYDKLYVASALKKQGEPALAEAAMDYSTRPIQLKECFRSKGQAWPHCPILFYLDGSLSAEQQFDYFKNSLKNLDRQTFGTELMLRTSPMYNGVNEHPEFESTVDAFLKKTFPNIPQDT